MKRRKKGKKMGKEGQLVVKSTYEGETKMSIEGKRWGTGRVQTA